MHAKRYFVAAAVTLTLGSGAAATAAGLAAGQAPRPIHGANILDRPGAKLNRAIAAERKRQAKARKRRQARYALPAGVSSATLNSIAACESGGNPAAVDSSGTYRGKYQFDYGTWASVGGSGDPAAAPEAEQDYRAALLYERSGSSPWPVCG